MRLVVAALFAMLALLSLDAGRAQLDATVSGVPPCVREAPSPEPDGEAVLRAPRAGVASSPMRWAAPGSSNVLPLPSLVHGTRPQPPATATPAAPQFRRFPLLI